METTIRCQTCKLAMVKVEGIVEGRGDKVFYIYKCPRCGEKCLRRAGKVV